MAGRRKRAVGCGLDTYNKEKERGSRKRERAEDREVEKERAEAAMYNGLCRHTLYKHILIGVKKPQASSNLAGKVVINVAVNLAICLALFVCVLVCVPVVVFIVVAVAFAVDNMLLAHFERAL